MSSQYFLFYKIQSNNLNLNYLNILTNQTDFCFPKLYFSSLIRTKADRINKQLLINLIGLIKPYGSLRFKATQYVLLFERSI